ncbi:MAG TPA: RHS repeat-associated core domain-containing protein [Verrucomicrobiae bacterium]|jgi:RHS repeat-associated protein|nr:RHS repeat-associated core domain-containing protein [Verrucomicrobiae bacterium]
MVYLDWESLGNPPKFQCYVERKLHGGSDGDYETISDTGYGLSYLDTNVVNGVAYDYRVAALDTNFVRIYALASNIIPTADGKLAAIATAGNGFVSLRWNPIAPTGYYIVKHSLKSGGPYDIVNPATGSSSFHHVGIQNGVVHYYVITAQLASGISTDSSEVFAMPLATLQPLAPPNFTANEGGTNIFLSWAASPGAVRFELSQSLPPDILLTNGPVQSYIFGVPDGTNIQDGTLFTFDVRAVNAQGRYSEPSSVTIGYTNQPVSSSPSQVILSIGDHKVVSGDSLMLSGPTNLTLTASIASTNAHAGEVYFYDNQSIIGKGQAPMAQMTWFNVPGGSHNVYAQVVAAPASSTQQILGGNPGGESYSSYSAFLQVAIVPPLATYQTSVTDLQLPAPGLPIALTRSYCSQTTNAPGNLGVGWTGNWDSASLQIGNSDLSADWVEAGFDGLNAFYAAETASHLITIILPGGNTVFFAPTLTCEGEPNVSGYIQLSFVPYAPNQGTLTCEEANLARLDMLGVSTLDSWGDAPFTLTEGYDEEAPFVPDSFTYTAPNGVQYVYEPGQTGWQLKQVIDANLNTLTYNYNSASLLSEIRHSNGRNVQFHYATNSGLTTISVFDTMSATLASPIYPVLKYVLTNTTPDRRLIEVDRLVDRGNGVYFGITNVYGSSGADRNRLTQVWDARGVCVLKNTYGGLGDGDGTMVTQTDALGRVSTNGLSGTTLTVSRSVGGSNSVATVQHDASGAVIGAQQAISDSGYTGTSYSYDTRGRLVSQSDSYGNTQTTSYDNLDRPVSQSDALGNTTLTQLNDFNEPALASDANGYSTTNSYDANGNLLTSSDPTGSQTTMAYVQPITAAGKVLAAGLVSASSQQAPGVPFTLKTTYAYYTQPYGVGNFPGEVASVTQNWVGSDGVTPGPGVFAPVNYAYDANGNRISEARTGTIDGVPGQSAVTQYEYDAMNRVVETIDPLGRASRTVYDAAGRVVLTVDALGRATTNTYDACGNLIETAYADGTVSRLTYDEMSHVLCSQDRALPDGGGVTTGPATVNIYDSAGRNICVQRWSAMSLAKQNDTRAQVAAGVTMQTVVVATNGVRASFTRSVYDWNGRVVYAMAANGAVTEFRYDAAGRRTNTLVYTNYLVALTDSGTQIAPTGGALSTVYQYDPNGNQTTVTDANNKETDYSYDSGNRLVLTTYPALGDGSARHQTAVVYDGLGEKTRETDEAGVVTAYTHDFREALTSVTLDAGSPNALVWTYAYDELGNLSVQIDPNQSVTQFAYDALSRRTLRMLADGTKEITSYADIGAGVKVQQTAVTDWRHKTIVTTEDVMGRMAAKTLPAINPGETDTLETFFYTAAGQMAQVATATNNVTNRVTYYAYDNLQRLLKKDCAEGVLAYSYTPDNRVQTIQAYRRGVVATNGAITNGTTADLSLGYSYDAMGRLAVVTNATGGGTNTTRYGYDGAGNLASVNYPNGGAHSYSYNAQNRLTQLIVTSPTKLLREYVYGLNPVGDRTSVVETAQTTGAPQVRWKEAWEYDGSAAPTPPRARRLTRETLTNSSGWAGAITNHYDPNGNRLNRAVGLAITPVDALTNQTFAYDRRDLLDNDAAPNNANPNYDANGNTLVDRGVALSDLYDAENRLIARGATITLGYDEEGNRVRKTVSGATTYYLVDDQNPTGYPQVLAEYSNVSNAPAATYTWGQSLISQTAGAATIYYGYDGQGNVRILEDGSATLLASYDYDASGNLLATSGTTSNTYRYAAQQWDSDLNMYYLRARYYKPDLGRFWTMDSYEGRQEEPLSLHKYLYCQADAVNNDDPSGHFLEGFAVEAIGENMEATEALVDTVAEQAIERSVVKSTVKAALAVAAALILTGDESDQNIPTMYYSRGEFPTIAPKIATLQLTHPQWNLLHYTGPGLLSGIQRKLALKKVAIQSPGSGNSWDEYPFATTLEGGTPADVQPAPNREQWKQGGKHNAFYIQNHMFYGAPFYVKVIP